VTVIVKHLDQGQGVATGLSTLVAEELDADWRQMRAEFAPADASKYNNLLFGPFQATGGSNSIANSFEQYRKAGAIARAMLIAAAAAAWGAPAAEIVVARGVLSHKSGPSGTFGEFAERAAGLDVPKETPLKDAKDFIYIGKSFRRLDTEAKITGQPIYTQDVHFDGMVVAAIIHPPRFGAVATKVDASQAQSVKGFLDAKIISQGVAVYARGTWPAFKAKGLVKVEWDEAKAETRGTAELLADFPRPPSFRDRHGVLLLGDVKSDKNFATLSHGPPSVHEARLGLPEQPSFLFCTKGRATGSAREHDV
jgi:isoquinoline 1-oxidoreductase beta subunit